MTATLQISGFQKKNKKKKHLSHISKKFTLPIIEQEIWANKDKFI